jgi:hypothetical protein
VIEEDAEHRDINVSSEVRPMVERIGERQSPDSGLGWGT